MLSRVFTKPRRSTRDILDYNSSKSGSILEYSEDCVVGFIDDLPLIFCGAENKSNSEGTSLSLREVLRASVGVMGESRLGMTEKVVLWEGNVYAVKRFRVVSVGRRKFGRRVERLAQVSRECEHLVNVTAYLYTKRIKFVLLDYFPMGSLADLLAGGRKYDHTALDWNQRRTIAISIARAIAFIHSRCPQHINSLQMNVHGNIKSSNVMININFTACLSNYGFTQLAELEEVSDTGQRKPSPSPENMYCNYLSQENDMYNYGIILLDMLAGPKVLGRGSRKCIIEKKAQIKERSIEFFEFPVEGKERNQALQVLDIALACTRLSPEARPTIEQVLMCLGENIFM